MKLLDSARGAVRAVDPLRADILLAAAFVVAGALELPELDPDGHERAPTIACGLLALTSLAFRRRDPLLAAGIFSLPTVVQGLLDGYLTTNSTVPFVAAIFLLYSIGRHASGSRLRLATALTVASMMATLSLEGGIASADLFWAAFLFGLPVLAGHALRSRTLLQAELREKAAQAERDGDARARTAAEDERGRIAAELQALVANGLSAMVVQAETVPGAIARGDGSAAGTALAAVEATGRDALTEMRRLLGVLRRDGDSPELAPQPGLGRAEALVERSRERGLDVTLRIEGARRPLPPGVDLTAYRVVEDALEAATEKGAATAEVLLRYLDAELQLQVSDDRSGAASDRLPGLRERVGLYGGHLRAGGLDEGGFRLRARLPLEGTG